MRKFYCLFLEEGVKFDTNYALCIACAIGNCKSCYFDGATEICTECESSKLL